MVRFDFRSFRIGFVINYLPWFTVHFGIFEKDDLGENNYAKSLSNFLLHSRRQNYQIYIYIYDLYFKKAFRKILDNIERNGT